MMIKSLILLFHNFFSPSIVNPPPPPPPPPPPDNDEVPGSPKLFEAIEKKDTKDTKSDNRNISPSKFLNFNFLFSSSLLVIKN